MKTIYFILMHLIPVCLLTIESESAILRIRKVVSIELAREGRSGGAIGSVKLSANAFSKGNALDLPKIIKRGDKVTLELGFDFRLVKELTGFVAKVKPGLLLEIEIEDGFFTLKRTPAKGDFKSISLKDLLTKLLPKGMDFEAAEIEIGNLTIKNKTVADVLALLRDEHKVQSWFTTEGKLIVGRLNSYNQDGKPRFVYTHGINLVKNDLQYEKAEDIKVKIKGENKLSNGKITRLEVGEDGGNSLERKCHNLSDAAFKAILKREYEEYKIDGFKGNFTALGLPSIQPGDIVSAEELPFSELNKAVVFVGKIGLKFDSGGYFREIGVGGKAIKRS